MKKKIKLLYCILLLSYFSESHSQIISDSLVFVEICDFQDCINDTVVLYKDSTFKYDAYSWWMTGLVHFYTTGRYSVSDSLISMSSFMEHKRKLTLKEGVDTSPKRVYEWDYDSTSVYYGRMGFIIELDKDYNQMMDTLFFFPTKEFRLESNQMNSAGFIIYVCGEYAGEYQFRNKDSNKITLWFSDNNYLNEKNNVYVKDYKLIIINDHLLKSPENGRFFLKQ